jgi:hypothetical protein
MNGLCGQLRTALPLTQQVGFAISSITFRIKRMFPVTNMSLLLHLSRSASRHFLSVRFCLK